MVELVADLEDLFATVLVNVQHARRYILPDCNNYSYNLRPRRHEHKVVIMLFQQNVI